jgi:YD repeat-containing protein
MKAIPGGGATRSVLGSTRTTVWDKLDVGSVTDRLGHKTTYTHDAARNLTSATDALGRVTKYGYDRANRLISLTDPSGKVTTWTRDIEGRVTAKTFADSTSVAFTYDAVGRLSSRTDALGQVATYSYAADNRPIRTVYTHTVNPTTNTAFVWDPFYPRLATMTGASGTTSYTYVPVGVFGALRRQSEVGPDGGPDTVSYAYDALGRITKQTVAGQTESFAYDNLGRVSGDSNALGNFNETYLGETGQLTTEVLRRGCSATHRKFVRSKVSIAA